MTEQTIPIDKDALQLVEFHWDCGRMGNLEGLFITTQAQLEATYGKNIYFGEVLGKHSEIHGTLDPQDITVKTTDQDFITKLREVLGVKSTISGWNPLDYIDEEMAATNDDFC